MRFYKSIFLFSLIFSFSIIGFGQTEDSEEYSEIVVPEQAMEQVVRRILIWQFKPRKKPTTIYLAAQYIQKSWLPTIKNIDFRLLSDDEINESNNNVYFFTEIEKSENKFSIGFAFGNPNCGHYEGKTWYFHISKQKVRLWQSNGFFIGDCDYYSSFA